MHRLGSSGAARSCSPAAAGCCGAATPAALPAGLGPADYHKAYALPTNAAKVQTVAIVDAFDDATIYNDLTTYSTTFGIPVLPMCGSASDREPASRRRTWELPAGSAVAPGWDVEIALDVETVHAICQNCKIVLVEAKSALVREPRGRGERGGAGRHRWSRTASAPTERTAAIGNPSDAAFNHPKKAIVVSAGDDGYGVGYPATLNTVIAVGGTRLTLNASGGYGSERAWGPDATHAWGTGSGCAYGGRRPRPGRVPPVPRAGASRSRPPRPDMRAPTAGRLRGDNDVAANADPNSGSAVYASSQGAFIQVGGTSLAAPLIAAVFALKGNADHHQLPGVTALREAGHVVVPRRQDRQRTTPATGRWPAPQATTQCIAKSGYDLPTGVGTPKGLGGFNDRRT